jgi:hypothetical protein
MQKIHQFTSYKLDPISNKLLRFYQDIEIQNNYRRIFPMKPIKFIII